MDFTHRDRVEERIAQTRAAFKRAFEEEMRGAREAEERNQARLRAGHYGSSDWYGTAEEAIAARINVHRDRMLNELAVRLHVRQQMMRCYDQ